MPNQSNHNLLNDRFEQALVLAHRLHTSQVRKSSGVPYIAHLLGVTALVLESGADEDTAIAALLHDAAEDQGGETTLNLIREQFGERVAGFVAECSDTYESPKPPWLERKKEYIRHLPEKSAEALMISAADKLHNSRSILRDLRNQGDMVWEKFNGKKEGSLWYYREVSRILSSLLNGYLVDELARVVGEIEELAGE